MLQITLDVQRQKLSEVRDEKPKKLIGQIVCECFDYQVDYDQKLDELIKRVHPTADLGRYISLENTLPVLKIEGKIERLFAIAKMNMVATEEEVVAVIRRLGYMPVNYHEYLTFVINNERNLITVPIAALEVKFAVKQCGIRSLVWQYDHAAKRNRLRLENLHLKISPEIRHLVIKNEAVHPIL